MDTLPTPTQTLMARRLQERSGLKLDRVQQALLATVDGHRNIVQLESVARAMGLESRTLERLHHQGLIEFPASSGES